MFLIKYCNFSYRVDIQSTIEFMNTFKKLYRLLLPYERKYFKLLLLMMIFMALLEMIGVVSIMPFIAVLANSDIIVTNTILKNIFLYAKKFGVETEQEFLFLIGITVFFLLIFSLILKFLTIYAQLRFVAGRDFTLSKRLVEGYLNQPYSWFLNRNGAELGKNILSEVKVIITQGFTPMLDFLRHSVVTLVLIITLLIVNPVLTTIVSLMFISTYGLVFIGIQFYADKLGKDRFSTNKSIFTSISEAFSAIKEIKITGIENEYIKKFSTKSQILSKIKTSTGLIVNFPRFIIEGLAFGGIILFILYLINRNNNFIDILPLITLYALAGYRLLPSIQQIYTSLTTLRLVTPALDSMYYDLIKFKKINLHENEQKINFEKDIKLENVCFNYSERSKTALKNLNLYIPKNSITAIVGKTGCGKTTSVDIILGLLEVQQGFLKIDNHIIDKKNLKEWQNMIGYVPQNIFLADTTIASNIAFGVNLDLINQNKIEYCSKIAKLDDFVMNELPEKYQTIVGERGVRLSGGQRQRIGIARALYRNPKLLVLDEATNALDNQTEKKIIENLTSLSKNITIVMIAHRLDTIKMSDNIFLLENGELKISGTFKELKEKSDFFN